MTTATIINDGFEWAPNGSWPGTWADVADSPSNTSGRYSDAICVGSWWNDPYTIQSFYHAAMTFGNIVGFNAGIVSSADLTLRFKEAHKYTVFRIKAVLPDPPVFSGSELPSAQSLTTAYVEVNTSTLSGYDEYDYWNPPTTVVDLSSVLQEYIDHANYSSGDDFALVFEYQDNSSNGDSLAALNGDAAGTPSVFDYVITDNFNPAITSVSSDNVVVNGETFDVLVSDLTGVTNHRIYKGSQIQNLTATPITGGFEVEFTRASVAFGGGYTYAVDSNEGTFTKPISIDTAAGYDYVVAASPSVADNSVFFGAVPAVIAGDQVEFQVVTSPNGDASSIAATGVPKIDGVGTGYDTFVISYFDSTEKSWQNNLTVTFNDLGYFNLNKVGPINLSLGLKGFILSIGAGNLSLFSMSMVMQEFTAEYTENPDSGAGFASVNKPSLKILDAASSLTLYANRDNTGEFQFLESGTAVDLKLCTKIELKVGNKTFSDSDFAWSTKFTKSDTPGILEVQLGELGLAPGVYKFYFVLYTPQHTFGIVWNEKDNYTLTLKDA